MRGEKLDPRDKRYTYDIKCTKCGHEGQVILHGHDPWASIECIYCKDDTNVKIDSVRLIEDDEDRPAKGG